MVQDVNLPEMTQLWQQTLNWQPDALQQRQFQLLYELLVSANQHLNLTRITTPIDFWEKHLWDSIRAVTLLLNSPAITNPSPMGVIDIGTGAGFPGLPIALAFPHWHITLLDSTRKKVAFIETLLPQLEIDNATPLTGRAEELGQQPQHRQTYDIALLRAVAPASVGAEYSLPLLKVGGLAILYRGKWTDEETLALNPVVKKLGAKIESVERFTTPVTNSQRSCLYLRKVATTPAEFPRPIGVPAQNPLV